MVPCWAMATRCSLVMIVKDEPRIAETIGSAEPFVERVTVVDTGSRDDTIELARAAGAPDLVVLEEPFVDFATARNRALELDAARAPASEPWLQLMLSGDEVVEADPRPWQRWCGELTAPQDAYLAHILRGCDLQHWQARLTLAGGRARYVGVTHECIEPSPRSRAPIAVRCFAHRTSSAARKRRWTMDAGLLRAVLERDPTDTRSMFCLGQSLECLGDFDGAAAWYQRRVGAGGWHEERFEAQLRLGSIADRAQRAGLDGSAAELDPVRQWLMALELSPHRAEPLVALAEHHRRLGQHASCYLFAGAALERPYPKHDTLFVDASCYHERPLRLVAESAWWLDGSQRARGRGALTALLKRHPSDARLHELALRYGGQMDMGHPQSRA